MQLDLREATVAEREGWDDVVRSFANHRVTHTRAWIDALAAAGLGRPLYLLAERDGGVVGAFPGLLTHVGPFRIFGSPLPGWQTVSMGPAFDPARASTGELIDALLPLLERRYGVHHAEIMTTDLDAGDMAARGFRGEAVPTMRATLDPAHPDRVFKAFKESARRNVRRAEKLGLTVKFETDEDAFVDEHYDQLREVYLRGGNVIPFGPGMVRQCFRRLREAGTLVAASVSLPQSDVRIASCMFTLEGHELTLWTWAHRSRYRWYRATELMTWAVISRALEAGCTVLDFMGLGDFKTKFGAELDESKFRWVRSRYAWLTKLRDWARDAYYWQQKARGTLRRKLVTTREPADRHDGDTAPATACVMGDVDLVRALGLGGIRSVVLADRGDPARFSRFTRKRLPAADAWTHPELLLETLLGFAREQPEPPVLFYDTDGELLFLAQHRDALRHAFRFVVPDTTLALDLVDKARFQKLAERHRLPVPAALHLQPAQEAPPDDPGFAYPAILKPLTRRSSVWSAIGGNAKALTLGSPAALRDLWPRLADADMTVLLQQLVPGAETAIESYHVYVDERGAVAGEFTGRKIRTWPVQNGHSTALEISDAADVATLGRELCRRLKLRGVAKFDFKRDPGGQLYLLEVNARFNLWHHLGAVAGVNLPALVYADLTGRPRPPVSAARVGVRWCKPWTDLRAARAEGIPFARWLLWAMRCEAKRALAWDDPLPLFGTAVGMLVRRVFPEAKPILPQEVAEAQPCT